MNEATPNTSAANATAIFESYRALDGAVDEMVDGTGVHRAHWRGLVDHVGALGPDELARRWEQARRLIHENGVTYNVYGDPRGMNRPWELDAIPVVQSADDWAQIAEALGQRARLLDAILADLYGPQRLLRERLIPPELVFAHPGFLRPLHGVNVLHGRYLHLYSADLGRADDGTLRVINDRTQAPSGAGYALENRLVLARTLPDVFRDCKVQRLASFFRSLQQTLASLAPQNTDNPRIILLTPGPLNETYFEHAYLARYLGYTLAEGGDLTVRDERVYLKTLGGLRQVDVILRRMDAGYCDPLELRPDSVLGVAGLVQAVRQGHVAVANSLGSSLVETPALMALLPSLCRTLLSQDLKLASTATWWCGDASGRQYVLDHLHELVIKPAFPALGLEPVFGDALSQSEREELAARIAARPSAFVGQERLPLSTTPALAGRRLEPRHMMLRAFVAAAGDGFTVMPGGLARFAAAPRERVVSMQRGGGSKDLWVLSNEPVGIFSLLAGRVDRVELTRGGGDLPSRVADNLFWLGRYAERAEAVARLLRGIMSRLVEQPGAELSGELPALLRTATHVTRSYPGFAGDDPNATLPAPERELLALVFDTQKPGSLRSVLANARRAANAVRDRLSLDTWHIIFTLDEEIAGAADTGADLGQTLILLNRQIARLSAFGGLVMESMTRGLAWTFLDMGRKLERSIQTGNLLRSTLVRPPRDEAALLEAVLEIADSIMTYRRRYMASLQPHAALDLLLADESNPRSVAFGMAALSQHVQVLPGDRAAVTWRVEQKMAESLLSALRMASVDDLCRTDRHGSRPQLDELLDRLFIELPSLSETISHNYLSHTITSRQLAEAGRT